MRRKHYLAFEIQRMLKKPYFFEDGDPRPGNSSQTIYHTQEAANAAVEAAGGGVARPTSINGETVYVVSTSASAMDQYNENQAIESNIQYAEDSMALSEDVAAANMEIAAAQIAIAQEQQAMSKEQYNYWKANFKPLEKDVVQAARVGIDPAQQAARAGSDVTATFAKSKEQAARDASRMGIDASSSRYQQQQDQLAIAQAAAEAGAKTQARNVTTDVNYQRMLNAVSIGRNLPSTAASISGQSAATYGAAAGTQRGAADTYNQGVNTAMAANNTAIQSSQYNQALDANAQASQQQANASMVGGVATVATAKVVLMCIPEGGFIDTPTGPMEIAFVRSGDMVIGYDGHPAMVEHKHEYHENGDGSFYALVFSDGTELRACGKHKVDGRPLNAYSVGDLAGGKSITEIRKVEHVARSYDLLTHSRFGGYRMAGVPVHSMIPELIEMAAKRYAEVEGA